MLEDQPKKSLWRRMLPRIAKAAVKAVFYLVFLYIIPTLIVSQLSSFAPSIFSTYENYLAIFAGVIIFFVVASELTAGTIYQHAFNIGRALVLLVFFVIALQGGIISQNFVAQGYTFHLAVDLRIYLAILISIDLLTLGRSVLQAIDFMSQRVEQQYPAPQPVEDL